MINVSDDDEESLHSVSEEEPELDLRRVKDEEELEPDSRLHLDKKEPEPTNYKVNSAQKELIIFDVNPNTDSHFRSQRRAD